MIENVESPALLVAQSLKTQLDPARVLMPGDSGYGAAVLIWNRAVRHRPAVVARCQSFADVQAAVRAATTYGLPLSVRGGGHDWAGRALRDGGLVIDLTGMRRVTVQGEVATVEGGATGADLVAAAEPHGLTAATGALGAVGMVGFSLAGGYGPLCGVAGLGADNLLEAEVVLADGRLITTDETREPDLFWALRGGGGNFGVVTALRVRLHRVAAVTAGFVMFPWTEAERVLQGFADLIATTPDELTAQVGVLTAPDGHPAVFVAPTWSGDPAEGEPVIDRIKALGTPLMAQIGAMPYSQMLGLWDAFVEDDRAFAIRTRTVAAITPALIPVLIAAGERRSSPLNMLNLHHFHGVPAQVPAEATAFGTRSNHFVIEINAQWVPGDDAARHRTWAWADETSAALAPYALPGGYPNLLGPDIPEQTNHAYGPNRGRLLAVKAQFDPNGVFTATPLPTAANP